MGREYNLSSAPDCESDWVSEAAFIELWPDSRPESSPGFSFSSLGLSAASQTLAAAYVASTTPACRAGPQLRVVLSVRSTASSILSRAVARRGARRGLCARVGWLARQACFGMNAWIAERPMKIGGGQPTSATVKKLLGQGDLALGDADLDRALEIRGPIPSLVRAVLADAPAQQVLQRRLAANVERDTTRARSRRTIINCWPAGAKSDRRVSTSACAGPLRNSEFSRCSPWSLWLRPSGSRACELAG